MPGWDATAVPSVGVCRPQEGQHRADRSQRVGNLPSGAYGVYVEENYLWTRLSKVQELDIAQQK
jgi:hypothetical protein